MKIISLNTWGGRAGKKLLLDFFIKYKDTVDIFCLQEMWSAPYESFDGHQAGGVAIDHSRIMTRGVQEISELLSDFIPYFRPHFMDNYGLMVFVRRSIEVVQEGEVFVYKTKGYLPDGDIGNHARNIQFVKIKNNRVSFTVVNFHGLCNGKGKTDSDDRLEQSKKIVNFIKQQQNEIVLCGDFNLLPDTQSLKLIESTGMRNLIKEHRVVSTRTSFYTKPEKFADYIFISDRVKIKDFKVLPDEVSDHAPLFVEII